MKKSKLFALAGITLLSAGLLAACSSGSKDASSGSVFSYVYETQPEDLNYITSGKAATHYLTTNMIDGLLENDRYGNFVPSMAEDWSVSEDGLTYTYKIRKDAKWYTSDGEEYADVTAHDFVTGIKYAADKKSEQLFLIEDSIVGLKEYTSEKDFSKVGVKALDDYTLEIKLKQPESFWNSKVTNGVLSPVNAEFLKKQGDKFATATDPSSILYNGPYILKAITAKSSIEMEKNPNYWDKDNVHFDQVKLAYFDGQDLESLERGFTDGSYVKSTLFPTSSNFSKIAEQYKDNIIYTPQGPGTYLISTNIDRQTYNHTSKKTDQEKTSTKKALLNKDFRQALMFGINRGDYAAQVNGKDGANQILRNTFVPPAFVQIDGKEFHQVVSEKLADKEEFKDVDLTDAQDGLYNKEKAKAELAKAKEALQAEGVTFPIHIDMPVNETSTAKVQRVQSLKQSVEETLGTENVVIDIQMMSEEEVNNVQYFAPNAAAQDWDLSDNVGWNPDYQDPSSYLDILDPAHPDTTKTYLGFENGLENEAVKKVGLDEFQNLLKDASSETTDVNKRYEKYAAAQAWLLDSALVIPTTSNGGRPSISRLEPYSDAFAWAGQKGTQGYIYKYLKPAKDVVKSDDYKAAREKWLKEREESNKKSQEELASHVK